MSHSEEALLAMARARAAMSVALAELGQLPFGEERDARLTALATMLVGAPDEAWREAIRQCPDLEHAEPVPDTHLHASELEASARFTDADLELIDRTLVDNSGDAWQKAERLVGYTLVDLEHRLPDLSLGICARRIEALVQSGQLEAEGKLQFMRLCKVRRPTHG